MAREAKEAVAPSSGVDALIAKLRDEGVFAGRDEAEKIVSDARGKAKQIVDKANKEAREHIEAARKEAALAMARERRIALEKRADLLHPRALDPDMIDERIRAVLGYVQQGDIVVPRSEFERIIDAVREPIGAD